METHTKNERGSLGLQNVLSDSSSRRCRARKVTTDGQVREASTGQAREESTGQASKEVWGRQGEQDR